MGIDAIAIVVFGVGLVLTLGFLALAAYWQVNPPDWGPW